MISPGVWPKRKCIVALAGSSSDGVNSKDISCHCSCTRIGRLPGRTQKMRARVGWPSTSSRGTPVEQSTRTVSAASAIPPRLARSRNKPSVRCPLMLDPPHFVTLKAQSSRTALALAQYIRDNDLNLCPRVACRAAFRGFNPWKYVTVNRFWR